MAEELTKKYGYWGEHPNYPWCDWVYQVTCAHTRESYWAWVENRMEEDLFESAECARSVI